MDKTPKFQLPLILSGQKQKHLSYNEAMFHLDALSQLTIITRQLAIPPSTPNEGACYLIAANPSEEWETHAGELAYYAQGAFTYIAPKKGWLGYIEDEGLHFRFDGLEWVEMNSAQEPPSQLDMLGIHMEANEYRRLSVNAESSLFTAETQDHRLTINKAATSGTSSVIFQDQYQGYAELGLIGDDDFRFKVSGDNINWHEAIKINKENGEVSFPSGSTHFREFLTNHRIYYVDKALGSDANDGLNPANGAFNTIQHAVNVAAALDASIYNITIKIANGIYEEGAYLDIKGNGNLRLTLEGESHEDTVIKGSYYGITVQYSTNVTLKNLKIDGLYVGVWARYGAVVFIRENITFFGGSARHLGCDNGAYIEVLGTQIYLGGNSSYFVYSGSNGNIYIGNGVKVITLKNITFSATVTAFNTGIATIISSQVTWDQTNGTITGKRYHAATNGVIDTNGGSTTYLPGNQDGTVSSGGQYA